MISQELLDLLRCPLDPGHARLECGPDGLAKLAPAAMALAQAEGLAAHARSVAIRLNRR